MAHRNVAGTAIACVALLAACSAAGAPPAQAAKDPRLEAAEQFVAQSDRYLHQDQLRRGMKGYGLTVLGGTKIVRFEAEILSVLKRWGPHQDVILARLSGQNLETTGIIMGMSGSPVYVRHEGKDKLIGGVGYSFYAQTEPLCGIQPIAQMLAVSEIVAKGQPPPGSPSGREAVLGAWPGPRECLASVLKPGPIDPAEISWPNGSDRPPAPRPRLVSLSTPLMISGPGRRRLSALAEGLGALGFVPVQAGGVSAAVARAAENVRLEPGAAISVQLVTGDADWYGVGTVTDVVGEQVLAFAHAFFGEGTLQLPMGTAYVHTVVPGLLQSFKLTSTLKVTGALNRDEYVGVAGRIGGKASMIPMSVTVEWKHENRRQSFRYEVCRHRLMTPLLVSYLIDDSASGWRLLPERHTVRHSVEIDFGRMGRYRTSDVSSGSDVYGAISDGVRPLLAMLRNPFGKPPDVRSIDVRLTIEPGWKIAEILDLKLDGRVYRPGETVTGTVAIRPFRELRKRLPVRFELPDDLPEGTYTLTACDDRAATSALQTEKPQLFDPRTVPQLLEAVRRVVALDADRLYLRLPLKRGGLAIRDTELPDLPESKLRILAAADQLDTHEFTDALVRSVQAEYVLAGSASAAIEVQLRPEEIRMRGRRNPGQ